MENKVRDFFDSIAGQWTNELDDVNKIKCLIDLLGIGRGDDVLDVGCGKGIITPFLQEKSQKQVIAVDLSQNMIDGAKSIYNDESKYKFICKDFLDGDYESRFDYIVIFNAYPHFLDVERLRDTAYKALKPNGHFAIIHSLSKEELNTHHKQHAMKVSRPLESAENEAKKFDSKFRIEKTLDEKDRYLIILSKNQ